MQNISPFLIGLNPPANSLKQATTSCKIVETLSRIRSFLLQVAAGHRSVRYNTDLPPPSHSKLNLQVWVWSCIANNFDKGWRGNHRDKIMDRPFMPKYGTVSRVLWQLVVALTKFGKIFTDINAMEVNCIDIDRKKRGNKKAMFLPKRKPDIKVDVIFAVKQTI